MCSVCEQYAQHFGIYRAVTKVRRLGIAPGDYGHDPNYIYEAKGK